MTRQSRQNAAPGAAKWNILLALASLLIVGAAGEFTIRAFFPVEHLQEIIQYDPTLGWALRPGAVESHVYDIHINSLGMRDEEFPADKAVGTRRILHVGDSIAFGLGVDAQWRYSDYLDRALGDDVEVINAAVPGWGTDQEVLHFEQVADRLRPDIVVLNFTMMNDVINNGLAHCFLQTSRKPRFAVRDDELVLTDAVPAVPPVVTPLYKRALKKSELLVFVKRRLHHLRRPKAEHKPAFPPGFGRDAVVEPLNHWSVFEIDAKPEVVEAWQTTEALIARLDKACRGVGAELIVFPFPVVEADDEWRRWLIESTGTDERRYDFHAPFARLESFCAARGIEYVYPIDEFRAESKRHKLIFENDGHPNRLGHALAAKVLLDYLGARHDLAYSVPAGDREYLYPAH